MGVISVLGFMVVSLVVVSGEAHSVVVDFNSAVDTSATGMDRACTVGAAPFLVGCLSAEELFDSPVVGLTGLVGDVSGDGHRIPVSGLDCPVLVITAAGVRPAPDPLAPGTAVEFVAGTE